MEEAISSVDIIFICERFPEFFFLAILKGWLIDVLRCCCSMLLFGVDRCTSKRLPPAISEHLELLTSFGTATSVCMEGVLLLLLDVEAFIALPEVLYLAILEGFLMFAAVAWLCKLSGLPLSVALSQELPPLLPTLGEVVPLPESSSLDERGSLRDSSRSSKAKKL